MEQNLLSRPLPPDLRPPKGQVRAEQKASFAVPRLFHREIYRKR
jgi:hypothetical protein